MESTTRWGKGTRVHDADRGREMLLNAAINCITRDGLKLTTMQNIADEAHITRRTVHRYFPTKRDLILEVTLYIEDKTFHSIEQAASRYEDDFFAYLEEAIVLGVSGLTVLEHFKEQVSSDAETDSEPGLEITANAYHDAQLTRWARLLRKPYRNQVALKRGEQSIASLETYAELAILFVTGHYQLQSSEKRIRESFRNMRALSMRYHNSVDQDRYDIPVQGDTLARPAGQRVKSLFMK